MNLRGGQSHRIVATAGGVLSGLLCLALSLGFCGAGEASASASAGAKQVVYTYDARPLQRLDLKDPRQAARIWDTMHLLASLQGLVNREAARLYLFYCADFGVDTDSFWFAWLRGEDGWLKGAETCALTDLEDALGRFREDFDGLVVYDPEVPATANVASTAAGCERLLPVRYDPGAGSLFTRLTHTLRLPVKLWLLNPDGSAKFTGRGRLAYSMEG